MRHLSLFLILISVGACKGTPPPEEPTQEPTPEVTPTAPAVETEERTVAFRAIKAQLRKRLAADKAVVSNKLGYEQAIEKHEGEMKQAGMDKRIPTEPLDLTKLRESVRVHAEKNALTVVGLELGAPEPSKPLPSEHPGPGPYPYTIDQMFDRFPVKLTLSPPSEGRLKSFFAGQKSAVMPSLDLVAVRLDRSSASFTGYVYRRLDVAPPQHSPPRLTLESAAGAAGVAVPAGHARLGEASALIAEHHAMEPTLKEALVVLSRVHLLGLQKRFFKQRTEAMEKRAFPRPIGSPKGDKAAGHKGSGAKP